MTRKYQSFAEQFYLEDASLLQRFRRDMKLLLFLFKTGWMWATGGNKMREEFHHSQESGEPFYVDRFDPANRQE
jgi:hypothetical protein